MAVFLFALAGIPLTSGFVGKFSVFYTAVQGGHLDLALLGAVASVAGMFYYLRVVWAMYFTEPEGAVAPISPVAELTPAPDEQPVTEPASADGGAVAVAERVAVATSVHNSGASHYGGACYDLVIYRAGYRGRRRLRARNRAVAGDAGCG